MLLLALLLMLFGSPLRLIGAAGSSSSAVSDSLPDVVHSIEGHDIRFRRLPRSSGLSQTRVAAVTQDRLGFVWFATQYGLNRFDGYKSKVFKHEFQRSDSLSCVYVRTLLVDRVGGLWIGCDGYLDHYQPTTESFVHYPIKSDGAGIVSQLTDIGEDHEGKLWIATTKGLYEFDPNESQVIRFVHDPQNPYSLSSNLINQAQEDREGRLWVATAGGLDQFDVRTGRVQRRAPLHMPVGWSHQDRFGVLWMTGEDLSCALASWDPKADQVQCHGIQYAGVKGTEKINVGRIIEEADGTLWLTSSHGLLKLGPDRNKVIRYHSDPSDMESLESDKMISIFQDREANIWTCFQVTEPNYFARGLQNFENFTYQRHALVDPLVTSIYEDHRGILWIASMGGLNRIDRRTGTNTVPPGSGVRNEILSILEDHTHILMAGTYHRGLERINPDSGQMSPYLGGTRAPSKDSPIMKLMFDHAGELWAATYGGIGRFNVQSGDFMLSSPDPQDKVEYQSIAEDEDRKIWIGGQTGLHHFDPATQRFTLFQHRPNVASSLSDNRVNTIHIDRSTGMWVGTQNGLNRFDQTTKTFSVYTERDGLAGNVVSCILQDRVGALWMSTNNGVSRMDPKSKRFENYSASDGLPGPDLTGWGACYQSASGEMFFGGFSGATAFYPSRIARNGFVPNVALTDFRLAGISVPSGKDGPLKRSITYSKTVEVPPDRNDFSIEFSALSFLDPETNHYRYRLLGFDDNWHVVGSDQRLATYTSLSAGSYRFDVEGATNHGDWSHPTSLSLRVLPAWHQTQTFRLLCLAAIAVTLWSIYLLRVRHLEHQFGVILEARVTERTRIARELHDTLLQSLHGLMFRFQAARNMLPRSPENAMGALDGAISRTEQAIAESRDAIQDLRRPVPVTGDIAESIIAVGQAIATSRDQSQLVPTFNVIVEGRARPLAVVTHDEILGLAQEVLANAFRHAQARRIEAEIRYDRRALQLRFRDDGRGIDPEVLASGSRPGHWGLPGIRERAQRIGAQLSVWSEVGVGTEVQLQVPAAVAFEGSLQSQRSG